MLLVLYKLLDFAVCDLENGFSANCSLSTSSLTTSPESTPTQRGAKESGVCGTVTQATGSFTGTTCVLVILRFHCSNCRADLILSSINYCSLHSQKVLKLVTRTLQPVLRMLVMISVSWPVNADV